jgi:hypothetical protein
MRRDKTGRRAGGERRVSARFARKEVCERVTADGFVDASDVEVAVDGGAVRLTVTEVVNRVRLRRP